MSPSRAISEQEQAFCTEEVVYGVKQGSITVQFLSFFAIR
jgi:hypothetical protein